MLSIFGNNIELTRGDTAELTVDITYDDGKAYTMQADDTLTLSVKHNVADSTYCLQKVVKGGNVVNFKPEDTAGLSFNAYIYDVELKTDKGETYTVIPLSSFKLHPEVTTG